MSAMSPQSTHTVNHSYRRQWAAMLTLVYMLITLSPLAPFAMHSKYVAHAVTGECSGDCHVDGCSLESRANHTCCCAQKEMKLAGVALLSTSACCVPKVVVPVVAKGGCCATPQPVTTKNDWIVVEDNYCEISERHQHDVVPQSVPDEGISPKKEAVYYKCGHPCGNGKLLAVASVASSELLPYFYSENIGISHEITQYSSHLHHMTSRHVEPPDPPPKLSEIV